MGVLPVQVAGGDATYDRRTQPTRKTWRGSFTEQATELHGPVDEWMLLARRFLIDYRLDSDHYLQDAAPRLRNREGPLRLWSKISNCWAACRSYLGLKTSYATSPSFRITSCNVRACAYNCREKSNNFSKSRALRGRFLETLA